MVKASSFKAQEALDNNLINGIANNLEDIFKYIPAGAFYDFGKHVFPDLLQKGIPIQTHILSPTEAVFGADTLEYLERTREYFEELREL